jgi:capsular polysaccharide biosynthesis protein
MDGLGLAPQDREGLVPDVHVVPETALVDATITARSPGVAERTADALATRAEGELSTTFRPYRIAVVSPAEGTAKRSGPGTGTLVGVVVLVALVVGVLAQQAVLFVSNARERAEQRRRRTPSEPPASGGGSVARAG